MRLQKSDVRQKATGSHVNFRTTCLTPEEYADLERKSREWKDGMQTIIPPNELPANVPPGL